MNLNQRKQRRKFAETLLSNFLRTLEQEPIMLKKIAAVFLLAFVVTPSLAQTEKPEKVLKIISSLPRTGSANAQTTTMVNGIQLAIDEVHGKIGDYTIVYEDRQSAARQLGSCRRSAERQQGCARRECDCLHRNV